MCYVFLSYLIQLCMEVSSSSLIIPYQETGIKRPWVPDFSFVSLSTSTLQHLLHYHITKSCVWWDISTKWGKSLFTSNSSIFRQTHHWSNWQRQHPAVYLLTSVKMRLQRYLKSWNHLVMITSSSVGNPQLEFLSVLKALSFTELTQIQSLRF